MRVGLTIGVRRRLRARAPHQPCDGKDGAASNESLGLIVGEVETGGVRFLDRREQLEDRLNRRVLARVHPVVSRDVLDHALLGDECEALRSGADPKPHIVAEAKCAHSVSIAVFARETRLGAIGVSGRAETRRRTRRDREQRATGHAPEIMTISEGESVTAERTDSSHASLAQRSFVVITPTVSIPTPLSSSQFSRRPGK